MNFNEKDKKLLPKGTILLWWILGRVYRNGGWSGGGRRGVWGNRRFPSKTDWVMVGRQVKKI